jgi:hypothetical protein
MREFSKVGQSVWNSQRFKKLSDSDKLFYLYVLTTRHGNSSGCFELHPGYVMVDLKWSESKVLEAIDSLCASGLIAYHKNENSLLIDKFFDYNPPTNPKHAAKVISDILLIAYTPLKSIAISNLIKYLNKQKWKISEKSQELLDRVSTESLTSTLTSTGTSIEIDDDTRARKPIRPYVILGKQIADLVGWSDSPNWNGNFSLVDTWLKNGWDAELDILPAIRQVMASRKSSDPPSTMKYFEKAIANAHATRTQPLPKGKPNEIASRKPTVAERLDAAGDRAVEELMAEFRAGNGKQVLAIEGPDKPKLPDF